MSGLLTTRGRALLAAGVGAWLLSRLLGVPEIGMAAVAMLALVVLGAIFTHLSSARLSLRRQVHPHRLFFDAEGVVELRLRNSGRLPTAVLQLEDSVPGALADGARFVMAPLRPGHAATLRYHLRGRHRGRFGLGPVEVRLRDPFGVAARGQTIGSTDEVVVYPPVWRLDPGLPLGGRQAATGSGRPRPMATGEELANVREYVRGDDLRKVHWRSTAHRGKLMVRQDEAPQHPASVVVLDCRSRTHHGTGMSSSFEEAVSAAASVTYHLSQRSYRVRLVTDAQGRQPRAAPWELVLERLAVAEPRRAVDMDGVWRQLAHGAAGEGVLATITTVPPPEELRLMVRAGRAFASRIALLVDADSFAPRPRGGAPVDSTRTALAAAGWHVTVLSRGDRLDERWRELLVSPERSRTRR